MRMRTQWFKNHTQRRPEETASVLAFLFWQIAFDRLKHLRDAQFDIFNPKISMEVMSEFLAFLIHMTDRQIYETFPDKARDTIIQSLAKDIATIFDENATDALGVGAHNKQFIQLLNHRLTQYSTIHGQGNNNEALRYSLARLLTSFIENYVTGEDQNWMAQQLMEIETPILYQKMDQAFNDLLGHYK